MSTNPDDDTIECPLCMEALEVDDINFFPCTCGYQICRFCWHRIRTDENGLCPACRKAYPEDPAGFKPLSKEEFAKIKAEKRHKNQQKKQKITENRKTLSNVRVVQKNLVFVLGLPSRFADVEVLKKHEYFGKFGKIIKVVINQSTSYAGSQAPCISAYVTYQKSDDALRAIQAVNNITVDGRVLKSSLGTTKYCSHFLKNQQCLKTDCMYLHEMGDPEASFTKEEMQQGKHQEFEKKLHDQLIQIMQQQLQQNTQFTAFNQQPTSSSPSTQLGNVSQFPSNNTNGFGTCSNSARSSPVDSSSNTSTNGSPVSIHRQKQNVDTGFGSDSSTNLTETVVYTNSYYVDNCNNNNSIYTCANQQQQKSKQNSSKQKKRNAHSNNNRKQKQQENGKTTPTSTCDKSNNEAESHQRCNSTTNKPDENISVPIRELTRNDMVINSDKNLSLANIHHNVVSASQYHPDNSDNNSFFSSDNYPRIADCAPNLTSQNEWCVNNELHIPDVLPPVHSSENWQAAFGFASNDLSDEPRCRNDDGLDFDPFAETQKALSEMIEKEQNYAYYNGNSNHLLRNNNYYDLSNHNNIYARKLLSVQQSNRIENCTKLLSELYLGTTNFPQKTLVPPPGFHNIPNQINYNTGIPQRSGNKLLPFAQQSLNTLPSNDSTNEWDWTAFNPSIVTAAAHRVNEFYGQQPPQGYPVAPVLDNKYMFNNYV